MAKKQTPRERRLERAAARHAAQNGAVERQDAAPAVPAGGERVGPAQVRVSDKVDIIMTPALLSTLDAEAYTQLLQTGAQPGISHVYLMPDGHTGYGCPVGTVAVAQDWIYPMMAGYDIGCGMQIVTSGMDADALSGRDLQEVMADIGKHIAMGTGQGFGLLSEGELRRYLDGGIPAMVPDGYTTAEDVVRTEEPCLQPTGAGHVSPRAFERGMKTAGSLGGGNHFLEGQRVRVVDHDLCECWGLDDGQFVFQIHCGSRGLGHQVGTDYLSIATAYMQRHGLPIAHRELVGLPLDSAEGQDYLAAMYTAANFSTVNRQLIMHHLREGFRRVLRAGHAESDLQLSLLYNTPHNVTRKETLADGTVGVVHRKGATRACPAGHEYTPPAYKETGHPVLIPSAMGRPSYILVGLQSGAITEHSVNHGAGRRMSRGKAKKTLSAAEVKAALGDVQINHQVGHVIDEAPQAYKDIDLIIEAVEQAGLARVVARLEPLFCMKGTN